MTTLANAVRVVVLPMPGWATCCAGVFVRSGSAHEPRALSGIGHVIEHMAFKGTATRDAWRINLDAERLGAEVLAHTDKDHTAFQMRGQAEDAPALVRMLGDLVGQPTFPEEELERERQVLLHEFAEVEDDPMDTAYRLFDRACFGLHPAAQPVIGTRGLVERLGRDDLLAFVRSHYTGSNMVVGVAGDVDADAVTRAAEVAFAGLARGAPHTVPPPAYRGAVRARTLSGTGQVHLLIGGALPRRGGASGADSTGGPIGPAAGPARGGTEDADRGALAAAVLGEGVSSPLLQRLREQRPLAYHATCAADVLAVCGQFVVEASTAPAMMEALVREVAALLRRHAQHIDPVDLDRARRQLQVRRLRALESPRQRLEDAAMDLFSLGVVREPAESLHASQRIDAEAVRIVFERLLADGLTAVAVGSIGRAAGQRLRQALV